MSVGYYFQRFGTTMTTAFYSSLAGSYDPYTRVARVRCQVDKLFQIRAVFH